MCEEEIIMRVDVDVFGPAERVGGGSGVQTEQIAVQNA